MSVTDKFGWTMPTVGANKNVWGQILNDMFDDMDQVLQRLTAVSTSAPSSPSTGDLWIDTSAGQVLKAWNGSVWITISAGSGANQLSELSDVGVSTPISGNVLSADGTDFDSKIPDSAGLVAKTGAQTIDGIKIFGSFPVTPSSAPIADYQTANKKYVDDNAGGGGFNEYTGSKNNMEEDDEIEITHPSEIAYDPRIVNFVREVLGVDTNWSALDFGSTDESDFEQGDVKGTAVHFQLDSLGAQTGHFEDSGNLGVKIGATETEDRIQKGCRFYCNGAWYEITAVNDEGEEADDVSISLLDGSASSLVEGTYAVSYVYGTVFDAGKVKLNEAGSSSSSTTMSDTLTTDGTNMINYSVRQVILASEISTGGTQVRVTFEAHSTAITKIENASIGIRTGSDSNTVSTPVELLFSGSSGFEISAGSTITSDWATLTLANTDDLVVVMDWTSDAAKDDSRTKGSGNYEYHYKASADSYEDGSISGFTDGGAALSLINKIEVQTVTTTYPVDQIYIVATTDSNQADTADWVNLKSATITEELNSQSIFYAFSFDGRTTWGIWDGTASDDGWRPIVRLNTTTWQFNSNTTTGATDVTWTDAATSGVNSQESVLEQAFQVTANQMTGTEANTITDTQWNDQTGGMTGFSTSVTSLNVGAGLITDDDSETPELDKIEVTYEAPTKWEPVVPNADWAIEMYDTSTKLIKLGDGTESVVKGRVRIPK